MSEKLVIDFTEMFNVLNDIMNAANPQESKSEWEQKYQDSTTDPESDMVSKYKKLYEATVKLENLKQQRVETLRYIDRYNDILKAIDSKIDELNKLFSN